MKRRKGPYPEDSQAYQQAAAEDREQRLEAIRRGIKRDDDLLNGKGSRSEKPKVTLLQR